MAVLDVYLTGQSRAQLESAILSISSTVIGTRRQVTIDPIKNTANVNNHRIPRSGFNAKLQRINSTPNTTTVKSSMG